jgi:UDP-2-acetamido-2,6-beta-L-arabino-hexul-4-ose reductase
MSSSIHASKKSDYGLSKKAAEDSLNQFRDEGNHTIYIYRLPNVFGKWCRPNYNSVIATFCHNISRGIPVRIDDPNNEVNLVYIDDVVSEFCNALDGYPNEKLNGFCFVEPIYQKKLINIVEKLNSFNNSRDDLSLPNVGDEFEKKLYSTFLSYYEPTNFSYFLKMNHDNRGSFTEFLKTTKYGQVSVNVSKPGITKGNHWHSTKSEKFLVVSGSASIKFRSVNDTVIYEYVVSGEKMEVVDIPPGFTHNITTLGTEKSVTLMWANEEFDPENTDTFYLEV